MKFFAATICVALFTAVVQGQIDDEKFNNVHKECLKSTSTDQDALQNWNGVNHPEVTSFIQCMVTKLGYLKQNGDVDVNLIKQRATNFIKDQAKLDALMQCVDKKDTPGQTAVSLVRCFGVNAGNYFLY